MPAVSVIIPCYNSHEYLGEALESVYNQTYNDYEIIIINDGSTNQQTLSFLDQLPSTIKVLHKKNGGPASARNFGIQHCKGEFIIALDSDDKFHKKFFETSIKILKENKEIGVVSSYVKHFGLNGKVWRPKAYDDFSFFLENKIVACCAYRKQCWTDIDGFDESLVLGLEDWDFWIRVTQKGWKVHVIKKILFYYRKKESSMMVDNTTPNMNTILDYLIQKHHEWYLMNLKKGILEKSILNKQTLTARRTFGLFIEKLTGKF